MKLMKIKEIATYYRLNRVTVGRLVHNGKIPSIKIGGNYRIPIELFERRLLEQFKPLPDGDIQMAEDMQTELNARDSEKRI